MTRVQTWSMAILAVIALAAGALMMSAAVGSAQESSPTPAPTAEATVAPDSIDDDTDTESDSPDAEDDSTDSEGDSTDDGDGRDCPEKEGTTEEDDRVSASATGA